MQRTLVIVLLVAACGSRAVPAPAPPATDARAVVDAAIVAMGGERLAQIHAIRRRGYGHWLAREFAEVPDGPFEANYEETDHTLDFARNRFRGVDRFRSGDAWQDFEWLVDGDVPAMRRDGALRAGSRVWAQDIRHMLDLAPHRLVLAARAAPDLAAAPDVRVAGRVRHVVAFTHGGAQLRLELDAASSRLVAAEIADRWPADYFWSAWGTIHDRYELAGWAPFGGVWFPTQIDVSREGRAYHHFALTAIEVDPPLDEAAFAIPPDVRSAVAASPPDTESVKLGELTELAPGVVLVGGKFGTLLVDQPGGVIVIDAPISAGYTGRVLDAARTRFGHPATEVVVTGPISPQLAGVRRAAAAGLAIATATGNRDRVAALLGKAPTTVDRHRVLGTGDRRVELYELGVDAPSSLAVYLPAQRLLYVGMALRRGTAGWERPSQPAAVRALVEREHLDVARVVGSQFLPQPL